MSNFELFYYLITSNCYLFIVYCYCLLFITATPLRRLRHAATRAPLSRSLRGGFGRLGTGPEQEAKQINHYTSMRAPTG